MSTRDPADGPLIAMVAGEASGDTLGAHLMRALTARFPRARFVGVGGPKMIRAGFDAWFPQEKLAVRGLVEVLRHVREIRGIRTALVRRLSAARPRLFIGVDAPDFNLGLERALKRTGIATAHYVSPTVWAWRPGRIARIRESVSHMLVLFPFEEALYRAAAIPVTFVGHPLADEIPLELSRAEARTSLRIRADRAIVTILPGSRQDEIERMAPPFIAAAARIHAQRPTVEFLVPFATRETRTLFERVLYQQGARDLPLTLLFGHAIEAMTAADTVLVTSGTATLEAALTKRPMVIAYRLSRTTHWLAQRLVRIPYFGLPNILSGEFVVPEFIQDDASPENLAQAVLNQLDDRALREALEARFDSIHRSLRCDTAERAADALTPYLSDAQAH